jgi:hypothetical protein
MQPLIIERLKSSKKNGDGWTALCPAHDDHAHSLSVRQRDGRTLVHCFAGCTAEAIVAALQLTMADLFAKEDATTSPPIERRIVQIYDYTDAAGALLYQVVRYEPKAFVQRRPDGTGGYIWSLGDVRRVVYRLHELAEVRRIYLVEGEKDVDNLTVRGLAATTTLGGTANWRDDYAQQLKNAGVEEVVILPDNDEPGRQYAAKAASALFARGIRVHILALPGLAPKGDVSDWLAAGHTVNELETLAHEAPAYTAGAPATASAPLTQGLGVFLATDYPPAETLIDGILSNDGGGFIGGEEKLGKSFWAVDEALALALALGLKVADRFLVPQRRRVMFLEEEDSPRRMQIRIKALLRGRGFDPDDPSLLAELNAWFHVEVWSGFKFDDAIMMQRLEAAIAAFEPTVVYVDVLRKVTLKDLNKQDLASQLLEALDDLRRRYGVVFRLIHHFRKQQGFRTGRGSQEIGGSYVLGAWAENSLFLEPIGRKQGAVRVDVQTKDGPPITPFMLKITGEGPSHNPTKITLTTEEITDKSKAEELKDSVLQAVTSLPKTEARVGFAGVSVKAVVDQLKRSERAVRRAFKLLVEDGVIQVVGQAGKRLDLYGLVPSAAESAP